MQTLGAIRTSIFSSLTSSSIKKVYFGFTRQNELRCVAILLCARTLIIKTPTLPVTSPTTMNHQFLFVSLSSWLGTCPGYKNLQLRIGSVQWKRPAKVHIKNVFRADVIGFKPFGQMWRQRSAPMKSKYNFWKLICSSNSFSSSPPPLTF